VLQRAWSLKWTILHMLIRDGHLTHTPVTRCFGDSVEVQRQKIKKFVHFFRKLEYHGNRAGLGSFAVGIAHPRITRNEKAVKPLKTNDPAKP
jgi:hypothetical protein